jgi:hypothetical protein
MNKIQEIKTKSPSKKQYDITPHTNLIEIDRHGLSIDIDLWNLFYKKEKITFSELIILQLIREYYE